MRKNFVLGGFGLSLLVIGLVSFGQPPDPTNSPTLTPTPATTPVASLTPIPTPQLVSTETPTPTPILIPTSTPVATESVPITMPTPLAAAKETPPSPAIGEISSLEAKSSFQWTEKGAPTFTIEQAVLTALERNPDILRALAEIKRSKGVILEITAQALPQIGPSLNWNWTDPNLRGRPNLKKLTGGSGGGGGGGSGGGTGQEFLNNLRSDIAYKINVTGTQEIINYSNWRAIRGSFFQRDSVYFALRNTVDQVISTVKTEFYQVVVNRELIVVQEESVRLLESQLKDQQNRFEAGTVPRFNVLQAQVQLSNQIPNLIAARNNYRISILQLAKTLGLDFNPARGIAAPLRVVGELNYIPRKISLLEAIELAKQNRPFLKQARANVLNQIEQVHVAIGSWLPTANANGGGEWASSEFNSSFGDVSKGWLTTVTGTWPIFDSGLALGKIQQQRALLSETEITYDDDVRQVELEVQQAASNLLQNRELIQATEKNVEQADEAVRLAKARLDAGAGTQLDVLNAQVQLTTAQSTRLQALFGYNTALAEFDRVTGTQSSYSEKFDSIAPRATKSKRYYTGSDVDARGKPKRNIGFQTTTTTTTSQQTSSK